MLKKSWFVICDWWISIPFVCFCVSTFVHVIVLFRAIIDQFASQILLIFLILVTCKNKGISASFPWQKFHKLSQFTSLFLSSLESGVILSFVFAFQAHCDLHSPLPSLKWLTEQKNPWPKSLRSLQNAQRDTTNFAVKRFLSDLIWMKQSNFPFSSRLFLRASNTVQGFAVFSSMFDYMP